MKQTDLITLVAAALMIALAVSVFVAPKLDGRVPAETAMAAGADLAATANTAASGPEPSTRVIKKSAVLRKKDDGHYWAVADVDGWPINFMVDTGASVVVLTYEDAKRMRLKPDELEFKWAISTAGGETKGASVLLESIRIGGVEIENVEAMILREGLEQNLLGQSFLNELYSYEVRGPQMIIRQ